MVTKMITIIKTKEDKTPFPYFKMILLTFSVT